MAILPRSQSRFSRRAVVGSSITGAALLPLGSLDRSRPLAATAVAAAPARQDAATELSTWKTWLLKAPDELRPPSPGTPSREEFNEVVEALEAPSSEMTAAIKKWGTTPATIPWTNAACAAFIEFKIGGMPQARNLALVHTAMHDAAIAAWDAQLAYERPSPAATDDRITPPSGVDPETPSYPSLHAAVAGAASTVLTYLLPDAAAERFVDLAEEAAMSRVWAGAAFPSDVDAGLALGKAVGELAVKRGKSDNSDATFDLAQMPKGPGIWAPTPPGFADPLAPLGGTWKLWVLEKSDQFRPVPFPKYGSPAWQSELLTVQQIVKRRTLAEMADAAWWQSAQSQNFYDWTDQLLVRHGLDTPHGARVLAYIAVSIADAITAVWDAKYTWWTSRPINDDPTITTAFPTPPYPDYPSGYSAAMGALSQMGGLFFPDAAEDLDELGWRATRSRAWAGIHYPLANEAGFTMGRRVARLAAVRANEEGALPT
jgi:membrane-associated phospholipid phosphatase